MTATRTARAALKAARQRLAAIQADSADDPTYLDANDTVAAAEQRLPWWKRVDIDLGIYDHRAPKAATR